MGVICTFFSPEKKTGAGSDTGVKIKSQTDKLQTGKGFGEQQKRRVCVRLRLCERGGCRCVLDSAVLCCGHRSQRRCRCVFACRRLLRGCLRGCLRRCLRRLLRRPREQPLWCWKRYWWQHVKEHFIVELSFAHVPTRSVGLRLWRRRTYVAALWHAAQTAHVRLLVLILELDAPMRLTGRINVRLGERGVLHPPCLVVLTLEVCFARACAARMTHPYV